MWRCSWGWTFYTYGSGILGGLAAWYWKKPELVLIPICIFNIVQPMKQAAWYEHKADAYGSLARKSELNRSVNPTKGMFEEIENEIKRTDFDS